jgi:hypothetical protein
LREDVFPASWINEGFWRYHAARAEEDQERVIRPAEIDAPVQSEAVLEDKTQVLSSLPGGAERTQVLAGALERSKALDTERMRRRDWVELQNARRKTGKRRTSVSVTYVLGTLAVALLLLGTVWWIASWIGYFL